jgi:hypothetical protein
MSNPDDVGWQLAEGVVERNCRLLDVYERDGTIGPNRHPIDRE